MKSIRMFKITRKNEYHDKNCIITGAMWVFCLSYGISISILAIRFGDPVVV